MQRGNDHHYVKITAVLQAWRFVHKLTLMHEVEDERARAQEIFRKVPEFELLTFSINPQ